MPYTQVMRKFKNGTLKSGGKKPVKNRKQAIAIMLSEKRKAGEKPEYADPMAPLYGTAKKK